MAIQPVEFRPNVEQVQAALRRKVVQLKDRSVPNRQIAAVLDNWVQRNFRGEGSLVGGWTPFKAGGRRLRGGGIDTSAKLLQDTGRLRISVQPFWDRDIVGIGSDLAYAAHHEHGTTRIPRRRILPEEQDVIRPILATYNRYFQTVSREQMW
ncbi:MAG TPA: phage virion morphogenesis protein [Steroidobacteraceae bacterium]